MLQSMPTYSISGFKWCHQLLQFSLIEFNLCKFLVAILRETQVQLCQRLPDGWQAITWQDHLQTTHLSLSFDKTTCRQHTCHCHFTRPPADNTPVTVILQDHLQTTHLSLSFDKTTCRQHTCHCHFTRPPADHTPVTVIWQDHLQTTCLLLSTTCRQHTCHMTRPPANNTYLPLSFYKTACRHTCHC